MNGIPVDYVMQGVTGTYDSPWTNLEDKLKNSLLHTGDYFNNDNITLYALYHQYICPKVLVPILSTRTILKIIVANVTSTFSYTFRIMRDHINFTLETYYTIMSKCFNDLSATRSAHNLNNTNKIKHLNKA